MNILGICILLTFVSLLAAASDMQASGQMNNAGTHLQFIDLPFELRKLIIQHAAARPLRLVNREWKAEIDTIPEPTSQSFVRRMRAIVKVALEVAKDAELEQIVRDVAICVLKALEGPCDEVPKVILAEKLKDPDACFKSLLKTFIEIFEGWEGDIQKCEVISTALFYYILRPLLSPFNLYAIIRYAQLFHKYLPHLYFIKMTTSYSMLLDSFNDALDFIQGEDHGPTLVSTFVAWAAMENNIMARIIFNSFEHILSTLPLADWKRNPVGIFQRGDASSGEKVIQFWEKHDFDKNLVEFQIKMFVEKSMNGVLKSIWAHHLLDGYVNSVISGMIIHFGNAEQKLLIAKVDEDKPSPSQQ